MIHFRKKKVRLRLASVDKTLILSPLGQMFCLTQAPKQPEFGVLLCDSSSYQTQPEALTGWKSSLSLGWVRSRRRAQVNHNATEWWFWLHAQDLVIRRKSHNSIFTITLICTVLLTPGMERLNEEIKRKLKCWSNYHPIHGLQKFRFQCSVRLHA